MRREFRHGFQKNRSLKTVPTDKGFEYTCEAGRPDTFSSEILEILRLFGINRISINPQTMKDDTLKLIDRSHTSKDTFKAYETARDFGFDVINMDLIMGLPGENISDFKNSLNIVSDCSSDLSSDRKRHV